MRILLLTRPFEAAPNRWCTEYASRLRRLGHSVIAVTGLHDHRGGGSAQEPMLWRRLEVSGGRQVHRLTRLANRNSCVANRVRAGILQMVAAAKTTLYSQRPDVTYLCHPSPFACLVAVLLERLKGVPFVYDARDAAYRTGSSGRAADGSCGPAATERRAKQLVRRAAHIVVGSHDERASLILRGVAERRVTALVPAHREFRCGASEGHGPTVPEPPAHEEGSGAPSPGADGLVRVVERLGRTSRRYAPFKRVFDLVVAGAALAVTGLPMLAIGTLVRARMGTPVLFRQERPGRYGQPFTMFKFRTMTFAIDRAGEPLPDGQRLTQLGRFLRATSLDELPELLNVVRGEMSLVGPRPLLMRYTPHFSDEEMQRLDVRPGITGWAQVNGRNTVGWDERLALDVWYTNHMSLALDLRILWATFIGVFRRTGVVVDATSVMQDLDVERRGRQ